jgi:hypothetical protein
MPANGLVPAAGKGIISTKPCQRREPRARCRPRPVIAGVYAEGSLEAAQIARMAEAGGAACLLVFPPQSMTAGGQLRPEMAIVHFETIAAATSLPLICFNYPLSGGLGYPHETSLRLVEAVPSIRAIKDWSGDPMVHERNIRALQSLPRPVTVLTTHSAWLLSSLVLGCNGLLSGAGASSRICRWRCSARRRPTISPMRGRLTTGSTRWRRPSTHRPFSTCTIA